MPSRRSPPVATDDDPRLTDEYVREVPGSDAFEEVVLLGVVHDHPASKYRVKTLIESAQPDRVAVELPPMAIPLFRRYAEDTRTPPAFGGEMSTAIQAAETEEVAGIDGPTLGFVGRLARRLVGDRASLGTLHRVARSVRSVTRTAIACRFAATVARRTGVRLEVDAPVDHDCRWGDDPWTQAEDEREQVRGARAVAAVFGRSTAVRVREEVREAHMAERLASLREEGSVAAVVGIDHLDALDEKLGEKAESEVGG